MDIMKDVATVTTIPLATLKTINIKNMECIGHYLLQSYLAGDCKCDVDIGIGHLQLNITDEDQICYTFLPSKKFEKILTDAIEKQNDPLLNAIENALVTRLNNAYKEFF